MTDRRKRTPAKDKVVALARRRAGVARRSPSRRMDEIFATPDPAATIRALPGDEFFYLLHEVGFPEALEVFVHGTALQVQTVLDFSLWERDRVAPDKADEWLALLVEAPPATLGRWTQGIDVELLALLVRQRARIYDLSLEEMPEPSQGVLWNTPDGLFTIDLLGEPEQARVTQRLLDGLYRYSPDMVRRLLVGVRAESDAEMEEAAFRWRSGRMADLGFADFYEALAVYEELDPTSIRIGDEPAPSSRPRAKQDDDVPLSRLPAVMAERLSGKTPLARALSAPRPKAELADLHAALVALCNRALSADRVTPGDDAAVRAVLERVAATLDLAIEFLARNDGDREVAALSRVPLLTLHRLGASLQLKLRRLARTLLRQNPFAALRPTIDIFECEDADVLASLVRARPLFPRILEDPPAPGERPFATLADLAEATRAVERAAAAVDLIAHLGVRPAHLGPEALAAAAGLAGDARPGTVIDPTAVDAGSLARTILVLRLLGNPAGILVVPSPEAVRRFKQIFNSGPQLPENARKMAMSMLCEAPGEASLQGPRREVALRWIGSLCPLGPILGPGAFVPP
ncbi:MAG: hypothetical protein JXP73_04455 [Deltaproteobacteria bacterium]|nr:hypothetical protein [Deltaproteobacteria bacterium]